MRRSRALARSLLRELAQATQQRPRAVWTAMVVVPEKVFAPERVNSEEPVVVRSKAPLSTPLKVAALARVSVVAAAREVGVRVVGARARRTPAMSSARR